MAIIQTVNVYAFHDAFRDFRRWEQFGRSALDALFEYLDSLSDDIGEPIELDVIGLCCDWTDYSSARAACAEYGQDFTDDALALDWLRDRTTVLEHEDGVMVQAF